MWLKKFYKALVCMAAVCCLGTSAWAAGDVVLLETLDHDTPNIIEPADPTGGIGSRASASLGTTVSANGIKAVREGLSLDAGETVTFDGNTVVTTGYMQIPAGGTLTRTIQVIGPVEDQTLYFDIGNAEGMCEACDLEVSVTQFKSDS